MSAIVLHLDWSSANNLHFTRDGKRVDLETAFREGFTVTADDAPAILTMATQHLQSRDEFSK